MTVPTCPEHGDLMLDLVRGRLGDAEAIVAEGTRESCGHCAQWWSTTFSDSAVERVDSAVADVFAGFSAPVRSRRSWYAAAAAAVLVVGVGVSTMLWRGGDVASVAVERSTPPGAVLASWDFEDASGTAPEGDDSTDTPPAPADRVDTVFSNDLESGDLGSWTLHS